METNGLIIKQAWRREDPDIERDARAFWEASNILPRNAGDRAKQVTAIAYDGDTIAGVATARLHYASFLACRLAMFRCAASPNVRLKRVATMLTLRTFDLLEEWSLANPSEAVMGMGTVIESRALVAHDRHAVWPDTKLTFVAFTAEGQQFRLRWFAHATVSDPPAKRGDSYSA